MGCRILSVVLVPLSSAFRLCQGENEQGLPTILRHLPDKYSKVLDLSCGTGAYLFGLEKAGYNIIGIDVQRKMVENVNSNGGTTHRPALIIGDAKEISARNETFDAVVYLGDSFGHFILKDFEAIARESFRVLRPGGVMICEVYDSIGLFLLGDTQRIRFVPSENKDIVSINTRYDPTKGVSSRLLLNLDTLERLSVHFFIWSPWMVDYVMGIVGFTLKSHEPGA